MAATFDKPELPKQDLLLKLLRLTESDTDGEALSAIRKANALLKANKWDWEKLLRGKITIIADPFAGKDAIPDPVGQRTADPSWAKSTVPPRPQPSPPPQPQRRTPYTPPPPPRTNFNIHAAPQPSAAKSWVQSQKAAAKTSTRGRRSTGTADINQL